MEIAETDGLRGAQALLAAHLAVVVRGAITTDMCARWTSGVLGARHAWTSDFDGDQFCLGRAFYTHFETDRTDVYFDDATASDARVEQHAPGLQTAVRALLEDAVGARVAPRPDWCGAGVHIFPPGAAVASEGGVRHFDTEGLADEHIARRAPAVTIVVMLAPPASGGGLRLWPVLYAGEDDPEVVPGGDALVELRAGDVVLLDSYRLHQIQAFGGEGPRISATLHGAEIDPGLWECWF
jgi:hypothetical protein